MNTNDRLCLDTLRRARGMLTLLEGARSARQAWSLVDSIAELDGSYGRMARNRATKAWGHRPCKRVGLRTKPFHVVHTRKTELARVGRILDGHRRIRLPG